jgi:hypothetical protein
MILAPVDCTVLGIHNRPASTQVLRQEQGEAVIGGVACSVRVRIRFAARRYLCARLQQGQSWQ